MPKVIKKGSVKKGSDKSDARPGVGAAWVELFEQNEKLAKAKRLTDEQITLALNKRFPGRKSKIFEAVATVRSKYNNGGFHGGTKPKVQSHRYDANGEVVPPRARLGEDGLRLSPPAARASKSSGKKTRKAA